MVDGGLHVYRFFFLWLMFVLMIETSCHKVEICRDGTFKIVSVKNKKRSY